MRSKLGALEIPRRVHDMRISNVGSNRCHFRKRISSSKLILKSHSVSPSDWPNLNQSLPRHLHLHPESCPPQPHLPESSYKTTRNHYTPSKKPDSTPPNPPQANFSKRNSSDDGPSKRDPRIPARVPQRRTRLHDAVLETYARNYNLAAPEYHIADL